MRRLRAATGSVVLGPLLGPLLGVLIGALLATAPPPVLGQSVVLDGGRGLRPGAEVQIEQLGEFLVKNLFIGETEKNLAGAIQIQMVSRQGGVLATYRSRVVEVEPGRTHDASTWITRPRDLNSRIAAPLKPAEFVIFRIGQKTIVPSGQRTMPRACEDATHAVLATFVSVDTRSSGASGTGKTMALCLHGRR